MKKLSRLAGWLILIGLVFPSLGYLQQEAEGLHLSLIRTFGYGGLGKIQGNFTLVIKDPPPELEKVEFYFDQEMISAASAKPFEYKFHTSSFKDGQHEMYAAGYFLDGKRVDSNRINKEFLSSGQAWGETQQLVVPILIGTAVLTLIGVLVPLLASRNKQFVLGKYGPAGGAVCPRCALPFSRSMLAPNLITGKLVRCPHCGKISLLPRASEADLVDAETRFTNKDAPGAIQSGHNDFQKMIDESRFED